MPEGGQVDQGVGSSGIGGDLEWEDEGWTYRLVPQGHRFLFTGFYPDPRGDSAQDISVTFGLLPGGAYVAIQKLLARCQAINDGIAEGLDLREEGI